MKRVRFSVCVWYTSLWRSVLLSVSPRAGFTRQRERKPEEIDAIESAKLCPLDLREPHEPLYVRKLSYYEQRTQPSQDGWESWSPWALESKRTLPGLSSGQIVDLWLIWSLYSTDPCWEKQQLLCWSEMVRLVLVGWFIWLMYGSSF